MLECMFGNHVLDKRSALDLELEAHEESLLLRAGMIDLYTSIPFVEFPQICCCVDCGGVCHCM